MKPQQVDPAFHPFSPGCRYFTRASIFHISSLTANYLAYKIIHIHACKHFSGTSQGTGGDDTLFHGSRAGRFWRPNFQHCRGSLKDLFIGDPATSARITACAKKWLAFRTAARSFTGKPTDEILKMCDELGIHWSYNNLPSKEKRELLNMHARIKVEFNEEEYTRSKLFDTVQLFERDTEHRWKRDGGPILKAKIEALNAEMQTRSAALGITNPDGTPVQIVEISEVGPEVGVFYRCSAELTEPVVTRIFEHFHRDVAAASSKAEIRRSIANLYQMLEWVHPFPDGQGRTDLILLKTILSAYGFTPPILDEPYMSTFSTLEDWDTYLASGMQKWQREYASKNGCSGA